MKADVTDVPVVVVTGANRGIGFEICRQPVERALGHGRFKFQIASAKNDG